MPRSTSDFSSVNCAFTSKYHTHLRMEPLESSLKYETWRQSLESEGICVEATQELANVRKRNGEVLFAMVEVSNQTPEGRQIGPVVVLRGHFVSVLTWLLDTETGARYLLTVKQRRICSGEWFWEHPSGMVDNTRDPHAVALKEVEEETGLLLRRDQLRELPGGLFYSSPGLLDEAAHYFWVELPMTSAQINRLRNHVAGAAGENEETICDVLTVSEAFERLKSAHSLLHLYRYLHVMEGNLDGQRQGS
jgi:8-oxo-dGTP pyrophosphatase MutT (NUDIX family)